MPKSKPDKVDPAKPKSKPDKVDPAKPDAKPKPKQKKKAVPGSGSEFPDGFIEKQRERGLARRAKSLAEREAKKTWVEQLLDEWL